MKFWEPVKWADEPHSRRIVRAAAAHGIEHVRSKRRETLAELRKLQEQLKPGTSRLVEVHEKIGEGTEWSPILRDSRWCMRVWDCGIQTPAFSEGDILGGLAANIAAIEAALADQTDGEPGEPRLCLGALVGELCERAKDWRTDSSELHGLGWFTDAERERVVQWLDSRKLWVVVMKSSGETSRAWECVAAMGLGDVRLADQTVLDALDARIEEVREACAPEFNFVPLSSLPSKEATRREWEARGNQLGRIWVRSEKATV